MTKLLAILGPTTSGKTAFAVRMAKQYNGEVINCDAMQMYADMPILSAQPTSEERDGVAHHLFGVLAGNDKGQAGRYIELARPVIAGIRRREKLPILCGGTGLYFKALTEGIAQIPPIPPVLHEMAIALHKDIGGAALRQKLFAIDPEVAGRLKDGDTQRLIRAWEVYVGTGTPLGTWQRETHSTAEAEKDWHAIILLPPRDRLYDKINRRFDAMIEAGVVDEVKAMLKQNYRDDMPVMKSHGAPEIAAFLRGGMDMKDAAAQAKQNTRNYAKRQVTWFTNQLVEKYPARCTVINDFGGSAVLPDIPSL